MELLPPNKKRPRSVVAAPTASDFILSFPRLLPSISFYQNLQFNCVHASKRNFFYIYIYQRFFLFLSFTVSTILISILIFITSASARRFHFNGRFSSRF